MTKGSTRAGREGPEHVDGRERRGQRNREKILQAVYELVRENQVVPTAEQVAKRARVGERTVFRHFADMESLDRDMRVRVQGEVVPLLRAEVPVDGSLEARARALVAKRAAIFEHLAPFRRVGRAVPLRSDDGRAQLARVLRAEIGRVFAAELEKAPDHLLEAADVLASFEAWDRLRRDQRIGCDRARRVVTQALLALFGGR